jgi:hypothetical protein
LRAQAGARVERVVAGDGAHIRVHRTHRGSTQQACCRGRGGWAGAGEQGAPASSSFGNNHAATRHNHTWRPRSHTATACGTLPVACCRAHTPVQGLSRRASRTPPAGGGHTSATHRPRKQCADACGCRTSAMSRKSMLKKEMPTAAAVHRMPFTRSSTLGSGRPSACQGRGGGGGGGAAGDAAARQTQSVRPGSRSRCRRPAGPLPPRTLLTLNDKL